jgi:hypothetical protein
MAITPFTVSWVLARSHRLAAMLLAVLAPIEHNYMTFIRLPDTWACVDLDGVRHTADSAAPSSRKYPISGAKTGACIGQAPSCYAFELSELFRGETFHLSLFVRCQAIVLVVVPVLVRSEQRPSRGLAPRSDKFSSYITPILSSIKRPSQAPEIGSQQDRISRTFPES